MVDISNKALALVLVAAIVVSLGGTLVSLNKLDNVGPSGFATSDSGFANITIATDLSIQFNVNRVDFGSGYTNDSSGSTDYCDISTNGTDPDQCPTGNCCGFNSGLAPLAIENIGNAAGQIDLEINRDNSTLIGGTAPVFSWFVSNNESNACSSGLSPTVWTPVSNTTVCSTFNYELSQDLMDIHLNVSIPQDATQGTKEATITATIS